MVCDARAVVSAKISNETLAKMLTLEMVGIITPVVLQNMGLKFERQYNTTAAGNGAAPRGTKGIEFVVRGLPSGRGYIRVYPGGIVEAYKGDEKIAAALKEAMQVQAARLVQRATVNALNNNPNIQVTSTQEVRGAMVIKVEL